MDAVLAALATDARRGLSRVEVRARLESYGKNELTAEKPQDMIAPDVVEPRHFPFALMRIRLIFPQR